MIENLGDSGKLVLGYARRIAANMGHAAIGPEHLFLGVGDLEDLAIRQSCLGAGLDLDDACKHLREALERKPSVGGGELPLSPEGEAALMAAQRIASGLGAKTVEAHHVLLGALGDQAGPIGRVLDSIGVDPAKIHEAITGAAERGETTPEDFYKTRRNIEQAELGRTSEVLETLGRDLTQMAEEGKLKPIIGRAAEIEQVVQILGGMRKNNALLIGDAGVGKTAIVEGLAQRIADHEIASLEGMRIRTIEVGSLVAGTIYRGQFEQRLKDLIDAVRDREDMILFIDEMHMLVGAGETGHGGSVDAANMLKPVLGSMKVIGATTFDEYRKFLEPAEALMRRFQEVVVGEPTRDDAFTILQGLRPRYEQFHLVKITDEALSAAIDLSVRHMHSRFLPDKAFDLVDRACTRKKLAHGRAPAVGEAEAETPAADVAAEPPVIGAEDIAEVLSLLLEIPIARLTENERDRLADMPAALKEHVIGQDHVIDRVCNAILAARSGVKPPEDRPIGVFMFLGPTGVGKTMLAEEMAAYLFGSAERCLVFDMAQYGDRMSASDLMGTKVGFVGWEEGGRLTNAVREHPYSVVLLDEFEKADPEVAEIFLRIFDRGVIEDALERKVDFRNTIFVLTSNLGSRRFSVQQMGIVPAKRRDREVPFEEVEHEVLRDVAAEWAPEFRNRFDAFVVFKPLSRDAIRSIVGSHLKRTIRMPLELTPEALEFLVEQGYEPAMGARPVRRAIQEHVVNPLSLMLVRKEITEDDTLAVAVKDGALTFTKATPA